VLDVVGVEIDGFGEVGTIGGDFVEGFCDLFWQGFKLGRDVQARDGKLGALILDLNVYFSDCLAERHVLFIELLRIFKKITHSTGLI